MKRKMSRELRIDLEMVIQSMKADWPYGSSSAMRMIETALGYETKDAGTPVIDSESDS